MWIFLLAAALADPAASKAAPPRVTLSTSKGDIVVELYPDKAPATVKSFLTYVNEKFYDGTIFHRVIPGFMIQGGGFTADMNQKATHGPVKNEADNGLSNARGTIAMARTSDPHSATSQFFINLVDNNGLDRSSPRGDGWGYTVFGKVVSGMEAVDAIAGVPTGRKAGMGDVPTQTVTLTSARQVKN
ncbi:MAG TPA: peptidylprolyl isomerase [Thermoanaerobaculia bacterium]|nr:peptidylprolyl isomerase [Thermoanaerobaculia bacterium]HXT51047.1 peptidylprolyl isomerase [Thermoanaerobaculia bacterium]